MIPLLLTLSLFDAPRMPSAHLDVALGSPAARSLAAVPGGGDGESVVSTWTVLRDLARGALGAAYADLMFGSVALVLAILMHPAAAVVVLLLDAALAPLGTSWGVNANWPDSAKHVGAAYAAGLLTELAGLALIWATYADERSNPSGKFVTLAIAVVVHFVAMPIAALFARGWADGGASQREAQRPGRRDAPTNLPGTLPPAAFAFPVR